MKPARPVLPRRRCETGGQACIVTATGILLLFSCLIGPVGSSEATAPLARVALVGDSLSVESQGNFNLAITGNHRAELRTLTWGGTAICDWVPAIRSMVGSWHPQVMAFQFTGNNITACTHDPKTGRPFTGQTLLDNYVYYMSMTINYLQQNRVPDVWLEGLPPFKAPASQFGSLRNPLDAAWAKLAASYKQGVHYYPAGQVLEWHWANTSNTYTDFMPCMYFEPCPASTAPFVRVRSPDGVHFCPVLTSGPCPVWSSGAFRYGMSMATPIAAQYHL